MSGEWETFYLMVGSSAAALIGLLFVVITLTSDIRPDAAEVSGRVYLKPTVYHFGATFLISAAAIMPEPPRLAMALVIAIPALIGLSYASVSLYHMLVRQVPSKPHWTDYFFYGALPGLTYLGLLLGAVAWWQEWEIGPYTVAIGALALLLIAIRDAWDLATYLVRNRQG
jgi:hypothetical protein